MKILITGANGFLGSSICEAALSISNAHVWAALRKGANTQGLDRLTGLNQLYLDYNSENSLQSSFEDLVAQEGSFDLIVHNAGLTKSTSRLKFQEVNVHLTQRIVASIHASQILSKGKFAYVSSQAALGPMGAGKPVSAYGFSKLAAEEVIRKSGLTYNIFRPTGIYGPRDQEFFAMFKAAKRGIYACAAPPNQKITLIHAQDVASNVINLSLEQSNQIIHLSDTRTYNHSDLQIALERAFEKRIFFLIIPMWLTRMILRAGQVLAKTFGYDPIFTIEKYEEISKDWNHDFSLERNKIPLTIRYDLFHGFGQTYAFYKSENWL